MLGEALPSDTLSNSGQSLPAKYLPFPPYGRRVSPIQAASFHLQSGDDECLPATQLYLSVFTCPTASLNPRASRPDNLTFSTPRPTYLSVFTCPTQRAWSSCRTPARASRPDNFTFSNLLLNEAHPSDTAISKPVGRRQEPTGQSNLSFPFCGRQKPTQPRCRLTARLSDHLTLPFRLKPVHSVSPDIPTDAGESTPGQTTFSFQVSACRG